jgi:N-acetyl sugar amidotransferase
MDNNFGRPPYPTLRYCLRCCMPETSEGLTFDELGICSGCRSSEMKMHIDWAARERELRRLLMEHKQAASDNYDCIVPISGGKDSAFQLHVLVKVYGMKPLAVTFNHNWYTETGKHNLWTILEKLNVDHVMFTPNRGLINRIARSSLSAIGDSCWHCHAGVGAWPLQAALMFRIPLLVWGESIAEAGNKATYDDPVRFDETYYLKVSMKVSADHMIGPDLAARDLYPFRIPAREELQRLGLVGIHLGDYLFWDGERQVEFIKQEYGWREDHVEGTYKGYKSVECRMAGVHDYAKFVKRGFGRATDHASQDVRAGLLSRDEGFELASRIDAERPPALDYYLGITGLTEEEFLSTLEQQRRGKAKDLPPIPRRAVPVGDGAGRE